MDFPHNLRTPNGAIGDDDFGGTPGSRWPSVRNAADNGATTSQSKAPTLSKQQTTTNNIASCGLLMIGCELSDKMIALKSGLAALSHNTASPNSNHGEQSHGRS